MCWWSCFFFCSRFHYRLAFVLNTFRMRVIIMSGTCTYIYCIYTYALLTQTAVFRNCSVIILFFLPFFFCYSVVQGLTLDFLCFRKISTFLFLTFFLSHDMRNNWEFLLGFYIDFFFNYFFFIRNAQRFQEIMKFCVLLLYIAVYSKRISIQHIFFF